MMQWDKIVLRELSRTAFSSLVLMFFIAISSSFAYGYDFQPTETEWATWPAYCKAAYLRTGTSSRTPFPKTVSKVQKNIWMKRYKMYMHGGLHHYCAGGVYFRRARMASNERERRFLLTQALSEFNYTASRIKEDHPLWSEIYANVGLALWELEKPEDAVTAFETGIRVQPDSSSSYLAMAQMLFKEKRFDKAVEILELAKSRIGEKSVELAYFLGLSYFEAGQMEKAKEEAKKAYEGGYPLLGLKNKLKRKGISW